ncbi:MAG: hypothetical protein JXA67_07455 [Micromonosporaceae bacterium]|nr:hypothetical protein [Micromonosporaceae bacterium]
MAPILAILCLPLAAAVRPFDTESVCPFYYPECSGDVTILVLANGVLAFPVAVLLGLITLLAEGGRSAWRRRIDRR